MGLYDTVVAGCTGCGTPVEFQSKAGDCVLATYTLDAVPYSIALDLDGADEACHKCKALVIISFNSAVKTVQMHATPF